MEREAHRKTDDRYHEDESPPNAEYLRIEHALILLDYYETRGQGAKAAEVEAELAAMIPSQPWAQGHVVAHRARAAELQGRKLDALLLYREAMAKRPSPPREGGVDSAERVWAGQHAKTMILKIVFFGRRCFCRSAAVSEVVDRVDPMESCPGLSSRTRAVWK